MAYSFQAKGVKLCQTHPENRAAYTAKVAIANTEQRLPEVTVVASTAAATAQPLQMASVPAAESRGQRAVLSVSAIKCGTKHCP